MSKNYSQLSQEQRYQIEVLFKQGLKQVQIAKAISVHKSTISRELNRNVPKRGVGSKEYDAVKAQKKTLARHHEKPKRIRFTKLMKLYCKAMMIKEKWSPEIISVEGKKKFGDFVSPETIYQWLMECKKGNRRENQAFKRLYLHLRHARRRRKRSLSHNNRGLIPNRVGIENRPSIVKKRKRIGDLEVDLMLGKKEPCAVLVAVDRATFKNWICKVESRNSDTIKKTLIRKLKSMPAIHTLTFDNDQSFSDHEQIGKALNAKTYFTKPYSSQDKGTVENKIGILRRFLPKGQSLTDLSNKELQAIEVKLNRRPVRKFGYKTPNEYFSEKVALIT